MKDHIFHRSNFNPSVGIAILKLGQLRAVKIYQILYDHLCFKSHSYFIVPNVQLPVTYGHIITFFNWIIELISCNHIIIVITFTPIFVTKFYTAVLSSHVSKFAEINLTGLNYSKTFFSSNLKCEWKIVSEEALIQNVDPILMFML